MPSRKDDDDLLYQPSVEHVLESLRAYHAHVTRVGDSVMMWYPDDERDPVMTTVFEIKVLHARRVRIPPDVLAEHKRRQKVRLANLAKRRRRAA